MGGSTFPIFSRSRSRIIKSVKSLIAVPVQNSLEVRPRYNLFLLFFFPEHLNYQDGQMPIIVFRLIFGILGQWGWHGRGGKISSGGGNGLNPQVARVLGTIGATGEWRALGWQVPKKLRPQGDK